MAHTDDGIERLAGIVAAHYAILLPDARRLVLDLIADHVRNLNDRQPEP